jgi:WD40 repeat protein
MYEGHSRPVWKIAMYDDNILASVGEDCLVKLWDTN